tara:strand:+ start:5631 stop:6191 length:561 start_codon:yes stop_codon:yes gene_type:complete
MIYEPRDDSYLTAKYVKKLAKGSVLDVGTGSGIQAVTASKNKKVNKVLAVDIQKDVITHCKKTIKNKKLNFKQSNLFSNITETYDTIIFNPPYLPKDPNLEHDHTYDGGKEGYEIIEKFLKSASLHLRENGIILLLFSSLTNKKKVDSFIKKYKFQSKLLEKQHFFFEDLYSYQLTLKRTKIIISP